MDTLYDLAQTTGGRIQPASWIPVARDVALGRIECDSRAYKRATCFGPCRERITKAIVLSKTSFAAGRKAQ